MKFGEKKVIYSLTVLAIVLAAIIWTLGFFYISFERDGQRDFYLQKYSQTQEAVWKSIVNTHKIGMAAYFDAYILKSDVIKELSVANGADEAKKEKARKNLYELLLPVYDKLQTRNVKQLHFQDKDNNSFLRFHQPHNFGDSLNATRPSIVMANKNLKPVFGFETGKVVSGFRNVFPIVWDSKHIGSVELSQPFDALKNALQELDGAKEYLMIIRAEAIMPKLFEENKKSYAETVISKKWLFEKDGQANALSQNIQNISNVIKSDNKFLSNLETPIPFASEVTIGEHKYVVTVTPVIDLTGKHTAAVLSFSHAFELEAMDTAFRSKVVYLSLMMLLAVGAVVRFAYGKKKLDGEKKRLLTISQTMGEGMYVMGIDGRIKFINEAALNMLGLSEDEAVGAMAHYMFHVHDKNTDVTLENCPIYMAVHTGERYEGIDFFKRKNGEIFSVDVISSQLKEDDEIVGSVVVFRDITERLKLEESLRELNKSLEDKVEAEVTKRIETDAVFKSIFENSPEGILILGDDGAFKECNPVAARMLGYGEYEIVGKRPCDISPYIQPESGFFSENAAKMFIANTLKGEIQRFEWTHLAKDGSQKLFEVMLSLVFRGDKKEILVLWRDITQIKQLEKEKEIGQAMLIQQSKLAEMGTMIGAIAHQWKQPLNAIWIMTQEAKMSYDYGDMTPQTMAKFKENMGEQIKFMTDTIEDFRNFYKPSVQQSLFSVSAAIRTVLALLEGQLKKDEITLGLKADDSLIVNGLESEFKQVVLNIINNAKEALVQNTTDKRAIDITVAQKEFEVVVSIRDNAGGIDEHLLRSGKIFEPYNTTKGESGTGIGLSLSKIIIEQKMQGKLEAHNIEGGAEFIIRIAVSDGL